MSFENLADARQYFQNAVAKYRKTYVPRLVEMRESLSGKNKGVVPDAENDALEAHVRNYLVDALLKALNWQSVSESGAVLENLVPEMPIKSAERDTTRFIDYFGYEAETEKALFVVETKPPRAPLPSRARPRDATKENRKRGDETYEELLVAGLNDEPLANKWGDWLGQIRDYARSLKERTGSCPKRVLITNGEWIFVFLDPDALFVEKGKGAVEHILAIGINPGSKDPLDELVERFDELFSKLEYHILAKTVPAPTLDNLRFIFRQGAPIEALHGLVVARNASESVYTAAPTIFVAPVAFLRVPGRPWLRLEARVERALPADADRLDAHLHEVAGLAADLAGRISELLNVQPTWKSITEHFSDSDGFKQLGGVRAIRDGKNSYSVVTGLATHFVGSVPSVQDCGYHDWNSAQQAGVAEPAAGGQFEQSNDPPVWFPSGRAHHCAHRAVAQIKRAQVTPENRASCGPRSAKDHYPFCEIWEFEHQLCCRTCSFENVCETAAVFTVPCQKPPVQAVPAA